MMRTVFFIVSLFFVVLISSCKKDDPAAIDSVNAPSPVFSFSGSVNGVPVSLQAGVDNYYITSSHVLNGNGVMEYFTELKNKNCVSSCANSLKISINDYRLFAGALAADIDSTFNAGYYPFAAPSGSYMELDQSFVAGIINANGKEYVWNFGDGTVAEQSLSSTITHRYKRPGVYDVTLNVRDSLNNWHSFKNNINVGQVGERVVAQFYSSGGSGSSLTFIPFAGGGVSPYQYQWDFGDGYTSSAMSPAHLYAAAGIYKVRLTVTDVKGNSDVSEMDIPVQTTNQYPAYFIATGVSPVVNALNYSSVKIEYTDKTGAVWTSYNDNQNSEHSYFKIISVSDYVKNENGYPTKKLEIEFSCKLYRGNSSIVLSNARAIIALAY